MDIIGLDAYSKRDLVELHNGHMHKVKKHWNDITKYVLDEKSKLYFTQFTIVTLFEDWKQALGCDHKQIRTAVDRALEGWAS